MNLSTGILIAAVIGVIGYFLYTRQETPAPISPEYAAAETLIIDAIVTASTTPTPETSPDPLLQGVNLATLVNNPAAQAAVAENVAYNLANNSVPLSPIPQPEGLGCWALRFAGYRGPNGDGSYDVVNEQYWDPTCGGLY